MAEAPKSTEESGCMAFIKSPKFIMLLFYVALIVILLFAHS